MSTITFPSKGFTGKTAGWSIAEYNTEPKGWRWWVRWDGELREGVEATYQEAFAAVQAATPGFSFGSRLGLGEN